jgi:hypothetical protein
MATKEHASLPGPGNYVVPTKFQPKMNGWTFGARSRVRDNRRRRKGEAPKELVGVGPFLVKVDSSDADWVKKHISADRVLSDMLNWAVMRLRTVNAEEPIRWMGELMSRGRTKYLLEEKEREDRKEGYYY